MDILPIVNKIEGVMKKLISLCGLAIIDFKKKMHFEKQ